MQAWKLVPSQDGVAAAWNGRPAVSMTWPDRTQAPCWPRTGTARDQLASAVRTVSAGQALLAPAITRRLIEDFCRGPAPWAAADPAAGQLTERELDVVRAVAQGRPNAEIAAKLYLSEATVKSHVARVLAKLNLRDRVQIAVFAYEKGIVRPGHR